LVIADTVGFLINEASVAIAQLNGTAAVNSKDPDDKKIVLTWIESNDTDSYSIPMISVSHEDFWKTFGPLLKTSTNGSVNTLE
jgi:hypothetical protein